MTKRQHLQQKGILASKNADELHTSVANLSRFPDSTAAISGTSNPAHSAPERLHSHRSLYIPFPPRQQAGKSEAPRTITVRGASALSLTVRTCPESQREAKCSSAEPAYASDASFLAKTFKRSPLSSGNSHIKIQSKFPEDRKRRNRTLRRTHAPTQHHARRKKRSRQARPPGLLVPSAFPSLFPVCCR